MQLNPVSTGLTSLDEVLNGLQLGDNVVWQVDSLTDYRSFARAFAAQALADGRRLVYMRFAEHAPLLDEDRRIRRCELNAASGFELFSQQIYTIATAEGREACYVFDCLSDLLSAWATDLMIGNFFMITCPYLFELDTVAYFALLRNRHNHKTIARIRETTQVLIDLYNDGGECFVHPLKVKNRHSATMFFPHYQEGERFKPMTESAHATRFINHIKRSGLESTRRNLDFFDQLFLRAEDLLNSVPDQQAAMLDQLCRVIIGRDERILELAESLLGLNDFLEIKDRLIGTGFVGGKTVGMLLARKIVEGAPELSAADIFEPHDSYYVGSDIFYTYIVQNGLWKLYMQHKTPEGYFTAAAELRELLLHGRFPDEIVEQFMLMIDYFGQAPIIVRSSSLLEDAFGNAFAGKYDSFFLVNQGSPQERYQQFADAVRKIYASTMSEDALTYRLQRGLHDNEEHMALLVQRVSGSYHGRYFLPDMAGVGLSYNTYIWNDALDPQAGMLRLVAGLGTRAVNRIEGDYPRIVSLDDPLRQPLEDLYDVRRFSQHDLDVLDIASNALVTVPLGAVLNEQHRLPLKAIAVRDRTAEAELAERGLTRELYLLTFEQLLGQRDFAERMRQILTALAARYQHPVDIEFTVNFDDQGRYRINLLQCRPHQTAGLKPQIELPDALAPESILFEAHGHFMGGNCAHSLRRLIWVEPEAYSRLTQSQMYSVARLIGHLNRQIPENLATMLFGPGRWGSSTPSLGVPIRFSEINRVRVMVEIARMSENLLPELSFGSHFFLDLVEMDIFYAALFPGKNLTVFRPELLKTYPEILAQLAPDAAALGEVVQVYDLSQRPLQLAADIASQRALCFAGDLSGQADLCVTI